MVTHPAVTGPPIPGEPAQPRTHRWGFTAFLVVEAVFLVVSALVAIPFVGDGPTLQLTVAGFAVVTVVPTVIAAATAVLITWLRGDGPRRDLGLYWVWRDLWIGGALGFGGLIVGGLAAAVWVSVVGPDVNSAVGEALEGLHTSWPVALMVVLTVVLVAPLCEEILYRGMLWGAVEKLGAGRWLTFAITSVVFAVAHFEFLRAPLLLVIAIPIGLARLITGRLLASIVAHQINNLLPGVAVFLMLVGVELPTPA